MVMNNINQSIYLCQTGQVPFSTSGHAADRALALAVVLRPVRTRALCVAVAEKIRRAASPNPLRGVGMAARSANGRAVPRA